MSQLLRTLWLDLRRKRKPILCNDLPVVGSFYRYIVGRFVVRTTGTGATFDPRLLPFNLAWVRGVEGMPRTQPSSLFRLMREKMFRSS